MCWWGKLLNCFCIPALWSTCKLLRKKILGADLCFWCDRGHSSCWNFTFVCWLVHKEQKCKHWTLFETWFGPHLPSKTERVILISNCKFLAYIMKTFSVMMFSPMKSVPSVDFEAHLAPHFSSILCMFDGATCICAVQRRWYDGSGIYCQCRFHSCMSIPACISI